MTQLSGGRRSRRSSAEVRERLIDAARRAFAERGFSGATTREIAESASTSEAVLFRQFGSKAALFAASVMQPFSSFVGRFAAKWTTMTADHSAHLPTRELFSELFESFQDQRDILLALMTVHRHEPDIHVEADLSIILDQVERLARREFEIAGWDPTNIAVDVRVGFGMLLGTSMFREWLYANKPHITDTQILDGMVDVLIGGVSRKSSREVPTGCRIEHDEKRQRVEFSDSSPAELFRSAAEWLNRTGGLEVNEVTWHGDALRIYY